MSPCMVLARIESGIRVLETFSFDPVTEMRALNSEISFLVASERILRRSGVEFHLYAYYKT